MTNMKQQEKTARVGLEKFSGQQVEYTSWKYKLLTHVVRLDLGVENELFEKGLPEPNVGMRGFLESTPPRLLNEDVKAAPEKERKAMRREIMVWRKAAMRHVLNTTLTNAFMLSLPDDVRYLEMCVIWQHLRRHLFSQLNQARNEMNRKAKKVLETEMMKETMICVLVLEQLPCEIWASSIELTKESFMADKVEITLNNLFVDKSKKAIVGQNGPVW
ncbi:hypothetical protein F444_10088 [Phytophthora nicotianae P1976]|uniref:Uncharacterized protein n=1 Tax=Phytophthora nicotianae P1976 TaxID=1317066 RepID=A0A081A5C3_PHYNI|nr:hypothetical protein F444_10088 [Phytophthora nicotianae P1976]